MKIIAFAGSNSSKSINQKLIGYVASLAEDIEIVNLTNYDIPLYRADIEENSGFPNALGSLAQKLSETNRLVISVNEHNAGISAFFKNTLDWLSRYERKFLDGKRIVSLSASPGGRGGASALEAFNASAASFGGNIVGAISIGKFNENFRDGKIVNPEIAGQIKNALYSLQKN